MPFVKNEQNQLEWVDLSQSGKSSQRCHMAGKEIDVTRIPLVRAWRICNKGCPSLSQCKEAQDT